MMLAHRLILRILNAGVELDSQKLKMRLAMHGVAKAESQVLMLCSELQNAGLLACRDELKTSGNDVVKLFHFRITKLGRQARGK